MITIKHDGVTVCVTDEKVGLAEQLALALQAMEFHIPGYLAELLAECLILLDQMSTYRNGENTQINQACNDFLLAAMEFQTDIENWRKHIIKR